MIEFRNTYARLPETFYQRVQFAGVRTPGLVKVNAGLAGELGIDAEWLASAEGVAVLAGNRVTEGSEPLALAYAGHQFGHFVPQLGDGRACLLGEVVGRDGLRYDLQLKGSGPTGFSRRGDGRAALGPVLREYVVSEAMHALGVPTTRALAAVTTGETVMRETALPGAVICRVAASHLRVGTFQYFAAKGDVAGLRLLAEYAMRRHYPEALAAEKPVRALLAGVVGRHARLVAQWMGLGFIHGVMNTDNVAISGETLDYGPCAFMEAYEPMKVFSSIDQRGRYAYGNQPHAAHWNLTRLAEALLALLAEEEGGEEAAVNAAQEVLAEFAPAYEGARLNGFRRKLGLAGAEAGDEALVEDLLARMAAGRLDFTGTFRGLCGAAEGDPRPLFGLGEWGARWRDRLAPDAAAGMRGVNPVYIPRNHLVAEVIAAGEAGEYGPFEELVKVTGEPFVERQGLERFGVAARPEEEVVATFCGT